LISSLNHPEIAQKTCAWARSDIQDGCRILDALVGEYQASLEVFDEGISVFKVYFYEILKLLTQSYYKKKELDHQVQPRDRHVLGHLDSWPYIGYADIVSGVDFSRKRFGKHISTDNGVLARVCNVLARSRRAFYRNSSTPKLSVVSAAIDQGSNLWLDCPGVTVNLLTACDGWFGLPDLEQQIEYLSDSIRMVMARVAHPVSPKVVVDLISRHIRANTRPAKSRINFDGDVVVLKSGIELRNRMLASVAKQRGLKVVNVMHGEAFGVYDEPHFSTLGETAYADVMLGYGNGVIGNEIPYQWSTGKEVEHIGSNGTRIAAIYREEYFGVRAAKTNLNYYYFPTTLSGSSHRYGPFRDIPDSIYIEWQIELNRLFGNDLILKRHPKEKYGGGRHSTGAQSVKGSIEKVIAEIDVFVFDYIGTAFNIACATAKPVVYFDLGIRQIHSEALEAIKNRVIYFDVRERMPSKAEIDAQVRFGARANTFTRRYSLGGEGGRNRSHSLIAGIVP
jgi:hypothetical protein